MPYRIKDRQRAAAKAIGVTIRPSSDPKKKIDIYKNGFFVASIGAAGYDDYASYLQEEKKGLVAPGTAESRRRLYLLRHSTTRVIPHSKSWYAWKILWS